MKKIALYLFIYFSTCFAAFSQIDITEKTQNQDLLDTLYFPVSYTYDANFESATFISNTFQIPANGLYSNHWDTLNIRSQILDIPFYEDQIKVQLSPNADNVVVFPTSGTLVQKYGQVRRDFHPGIDFEVTEGAPVVACFAGVVRIAKFCQGYGNTVIIRHYNGLETLYAHLGELSVKPNQVVKMGTPIGTAGKTGNVPNTEKALLHFETRFLNHYFDPNLLLNIEERRLNDAMLTITASDINTKPLPEGPFADKLAVYQKFIDNLPTPTTPTDTLNVELETPQLATDVENPVVSTPVVTEETEETGKTAETVTLPASNHVYHTVQQGETLYRISVKYKVSTTEIIKFNNLKGDGSNIQEGQRLRVK